mgnify:CR=1 FL=1
MDIPGFKLLLQDFCEYCPDFEAEVETINCTSLICAVPSCCHNIRCRNRKKCASIARNLEKRVKS